MAFPRVLVFVCLVFCASQARSERKSGVQATTPTAEPPLQCPLILTLVMKGVLQSNGIVVAGGDAYYKGFYQQIDGTTFRVCICTVRPCLTKCCPPNEMIVGKACTPSSYQFRPDVYALEGTILPNYNLSRFQFMYGNPCTNGRYPLDPVSKPDDKFILQTNGIVVVGDSTKVLYQPDNYCLEGNGTNFGKTLALICFPPESTNDPNIAYVMYPVGMIISVPFLFLTLLVYILIPELRNLHGKVRMCHISCLLSGYVFLIIIQLGGDTIDLTFCIITAYMVQFSFLATFFWLNIMSFDIWLTFSGLRGFSTGTAKQREDRRFLYYSLYAWGGPVIMLAVTLIMDLTPGLPTSVLRPGFGDHRCFFDSMHATLAYFYGPVGAIILCNIIFFVLTAIKILAVKRQTKVLANSESRRTNEDNEQRFILYLKLFLIMGVNWVMEVVSWAVAGSVADTEAASKWKLLFYITDICNTLQGVLIFWIFVLSSKMRGNIAVKLHKIKRWSSRSTRTTPLPVARDSAI